VNKHKIFSHIKQLNFSSAALPVLDTLEKHIDRIEYVKDFIGLRDVLFLAEKGAKGFRDLDMYSCLDVDVKFDNHDHNFVAMNDSLVENATEIKQMIENFFERTDRVLYLVIGFQQTSTTQEDAFRVYEQMEAGLAQDPFDALVKMRRFPEWYEAKYPEEILEEIRFFDLLQRAQVTMMKQLKEELMNQIDQSLLDGNIETFLEVSSQYNRFFST